MRVVHNCILTSDRLTLRAWLRGLSPRKRICFGASTHDSWVRVHRLLQWLGIHSSEPTLIPSLPVPPNLPDGVAQAPKSNMVKTMDLRHRKRVTWISTMVTACMMATATPQSGLQWCLLPWSRHLGSQRIRFTGNFQKRSRLAASRGLIRAFGAATR